MRLREFLVKAQFHGAKRLADPTYRLWWTIALLILLWSAIANLTQTVLRFWEAPTHLVQLEPYNRPFNFPSVIICPEIFFPEHRVEAFLSKIKYPLGLNKSSTKQILHQLSAFYSPDVRYNIRDLDKIQSILEYNNMLAEEAGLQLTSSCRESLIRCRWNHQYVNCSSLFMMEVTAYGFCCVFNGRSLKRYLDYEEMKWKIKSHKISLKKWVTKKSVGPFNALLVVVNQSQDLNDIDLSYKWQSIQSRQYFVDLANNGTPLSPGTEQWSAFRERHLHVSDDVLFMSDELRGCKIINKPLRYFPVYERNYCLLECEMESIFKRCRCLLPVHPRPPWVPSCRARSLTCVRKSMGSFSANDCDCPSNCEYQSETVTTHTYNLSTTSSFDDFYEGLDMRKITVSRIFIIRQGQKSFSRQSYFKLLDLFSQLGGVFNVFFGCSILTLLELLHLAWSIFRPDHSSTKIRPLKQSKQKKNNKRHNKGPLTAKNIKNKSYMRGAAKI